MVGNVMLKVLEERNFPVSELIVAASPKSVGKMMEFKGEKLSVISVEDAIEAKADVALFSAGGSTSKKYAPLFAAKGTTVIDNSSAWRMDENVPLIVPEVNADVLTKDHKIIANPNCSTIQLVVALSPLHEKYNIQRLIVSTYQSVTGTGKNAVNQLSFERANIAGDKVYPYTIDLNCIPHCDVFLENDYTREEMKLVHETRKILSDQSLAITATAVRVPVIGGHSESVNISFENDYDITELKSVLEHSQGVKILDHPANDIYPMPYYSQGKDAVFVGRIRRDDSAPNSLNLWIVSDNLRKGAATNAVQIGEYLLANKLL
ncbi:UNVERIFIED_CONTAM: hypothetical protein GTU68_000427 [Idotea baltica]|nr:hypothetical protein [Idotea baltica]